MLLRPSSKGKKVGFFIKWAQLGVILSSVISGSLKMISSSVAEKLLLFMGGWLPVSFSAWGVSLTSMPVIPVLFGVSLFMLVLLVWNLTSRASSHFSEEGESFFMGAVMYFIHLLGMLMKPLSLCLRIFINMCLGTFISVLMHNVLSFSLPPHLAFTAFLIFEFFVLLIQGLVFTSLVKMYNEEFLK